MADSAVIDRAKELFGDLLVQQLARSTGASYQSFDALIGADSEIAEHVSIAAPAVAVAKLAWMTN